MNIRTMSGFLCITSIYFSDNISVNTLILEELCINENTTESPEIIDVEAIHDNDLKCTTDQVEKSSNLKNTIVTEKTETNAASVAPDAETTIEKADNDVDMKMDNDINMKEIHQEKTQKSQESVKTQASYCTNKNSFKHSATKNTQDEVQAKRTRFQKENNEDNSNIKIAPQPLNIVKEMDTKSPPSIPKIVNIESVHYNIVPVRRPSILSSNMLSPIHFECCDSISSFDQGLMSKGCHSRKLFIVYCIFYTAKLDMFTS